MRCAVSERLGRGMEAGLGSWLTSLGQAGVEFVVVPDLRGRARRHTTLPDVDAVLLTEGPAIDAPGAAVQDVADVRSPRTGRELVRLARARRLPLVGIGEGAEFLGVYFGGRLVPRSSRADAGPVQLRFAPGRGPSRATVQPTGRTVCDEQSLPDVLVPIAWDEQDQIAGFVHQNEPILGIHWQPVDPDDGATQMILQALGAGSTDTDRTHRDPLGITNG